MKATSLLVIALAVVTSLPMKAQSSPATEIDELKAQMRAQQKLLEKQQAQIQTLESALATQQKMLTEVVRSGSNGPPVAPAAARAVEVKTEADGVQASEKQVMASDQQPLSPEAEQVEEELQRGPEIADVTPHAPSIQLGPAKVRLLGYPALTTVFRSTNSGGNVGTGFTDIPFGNTVPGNTSEFRLSAQSTRLAVRVDADLQNSKAAGYFEMDFAGTVPGNVAVSSSSYGFRIRQAWFDYSTGKFEITGGQLFSLMTPVKKDIFPWPGDVATTQVIDTNYVPGLVWGRYPQVRLVYHYSNAASFGFSIENPEQQVGNGIASGVIFPAALASTLNSQYNIGVNDLSVPNMTPDFVLKGSFDGKFGGHTAHLDVGGLLRVFRNYAPYSGNGFTGHHYAMGGGGNANFTFEIVRGLRLVLDGFASSGGGRYIGGLVPDVIVRADGTVSPITSYSWVSGLEIAPNKATGLYAYFSGLYGLRNTAIGADGAYIGWGYPGASNAADRAVEQATGGYSRVLWKHENLGSVQFGVQYAYLWLQPWSSGSGPTQANANMVFTQLRYNLP